MKIAQDLLDQMIDHARRDAPNECCGVVGVRDGSRVTEVIAAEEHGRQPVPVTRMGIDQLRAIEQIEDSGAEVGAMYHLAPAEREALSVADRHGPCRTGWPGHPSGIIRRATCPTEPVVRAFRVTPKEVEELEVHGVVSPRVSLLRSLHGGRGALLRGLRGSRWSPRAGRARRTSRERQGARPQGQAQYSEGDLRRRAMGRTCAEAELIQNLLLEEGVPSTLRRTRGFDVPEMLAGRPARRARARSRGRGQRAQVLLQADMADGHVDVAGPYRAVAGCSPFLLGRGSRSSGLVVPADRRLR
jgi:proteasome lid subunit RPN8/RPN11